MSINFSEVSDNNSTTPIDKRVVNEMIPYLEEKFGNYSSKHRYGYESFSAVELAREKIARLINANPDEIIFTSGATESINLAHIGFALSKNYKGKHIISSMVEHSASYESLNFLSKHGFEIIFIKPDNYGRIDPEEIMKNVRKDTILISLIFANNEIGTVNELQMISEFCSENKIVFHTDATQAIGKIEIDIRKLNPSMMSFTAHKIYGQKGIGALFINRNSFKINISPLIFGGNQENSLRSGTLNVPAIVGFGKACKILSDEMQSDLNHYKKLSDHIYKNMISNLDNVKLNGHPNARILNNLNFTVRDVLADELMKKTPELAYSTGSACSSENPKKNRVLKAIGLSDDENLSTFRISIGRFNTLSEIEFATEKLITQIQNIRQKKMKNKSFSIV